MRRGSIHIEDSHDDSKSSQSIAIVGSGIAGLAFAFFTRSLNPTADVHLFERHENIGMDAHGVQVPTGRDGEMSRVDVPLRVFTAQYYPTLMSLSVLFF